MIFIKNEFEEMGWETLKHTSYSPDLSSCDYFLFAHFKESLRGEGFESNEEVKEQG